MPTVEQNLALWGEQYDWSKRGDEWSSEWGGTESLWWGTVFPRIRNFVPTGAILEIAPGFGRCTQYLRNLCKHLTVVDLSERCIDACRERFAGNGQISYFVNDGRSLEMVPDGSVDFVFSFDSLVHADADVIRAYLQQLTTKLTPNGVGFIHHSNIGSYLLPLRRIVPKPMANRVYLPISRSLNSYWRGEDMTAAKFDQFCSDVELQCISQEVINWGGKLLIDCFSVFTPKGSRWARPRQLMLNREFASETKRLSMLDTLYGRTTSNDS